MECGVQGGEMEERGVEKVLKVSWEGAGEGGLDSVEGLYKQYRSTG